MSGRPTPRHVSYAAAFFCGLVVGQVSALVGGARRAAASVRGSLPPSFETPIFQLCSAYSRVASSSLASKEIGCRCSEPAIRFVESVGGANYSEPVQHDLAPGDATQPSGLVFQETDELVASHRPRRAAAAPGAERRLLDSLPRSCPRDRFMYATLSYGQHSNQLIALLNSFVIARLLNRTLIIGNFVYNTFHKLKTYNTSDDGHVEPDRKRKVLNRRYIDPLSLYDFSSFQEAGYCHVLRDAYFDAFLPPQPAECFRPDKDFIRMWDTTCTRTVITRRLYGRNAVRLAATSTARLVYLPETYWLQPEGAVLPYHLLRPSKLIADEVAHFTSTVLQTPLYVAVHHRMLKSEGHSICERQLKEMVASLDLGDEERAHVVKQCRVDIPYIERAQRATGTVGQRVFLASDRQRADVDEQLMAHGAVSYHTGLFRPTSPLGLMVDFWLMVGSSTLVCNMASSIDWNVCNVRMARGKSCYNWYNHSWPRWSGAY
eukprot:TRINITY_DN9051_c0_g1_i2.p1 TRINITY_DN9051_c0_g1~~TRINITY_DN9051_c0_g1_i2.p1  ORF type:complete len:489 (+),score=95.84 TRINITY_DN9051_c0_g1_i2:88-1554(+)